MPGTDKDAAEAPEQIRLLHDNYKPHWGPRSTLMYSIPGKAGKHSSTHTDELMQPVMTLFASQGRDIRFARIGVSSDVRTQGHLTFHSLSSTLANGDGTAYWGAAQPSTR